MENKGKKGLFYVIQWEVGMLHYWKNRKPFGKLS